MKPSNILENKIPQDTYWRFQLICKKVPAQFFRTTIRIESRPGPFDKSRFIVAFLTILGVTEILCSFKLALEGKTVKEIPESSRLELLEKFSANNFALSDLEDNNTSGALNRGGVADLPLLRTLLSICQKSREAIFWEVMDSYAKLARILFQWPRWSD